MILCIEKYTCKVWFVIFTFSALENWISFVIETWKRWRGRQYRK